MMEESRKVYGWLVRDRNAAVRCSSIWTGTRGGENYCGNLLWQSSLTLLSRRVFKVGDMSFKSPKKASELTVNCAELKAAAKKRIDQQSGMAGIKYILHHAERAFRRGRWAVSISRFSRQKPSLQSATPCQSAIRRDCRFDGPRSREDCPSFNSLAQAASHFLLLHPKTSRSIHSGALTVHLQPNMCEMSSLNLL